MASDKSKTTSATCVRCHGPSTTRCTGCLEAPVYDEGTLKPTFYCSSVCQKADWSRHKHDCKQLQARKSLSRAAVLLQGIIYRIRRHASSIQFKSARIEGSILYIEGFENYTGGPNAQRLLNPFPTCLDGNRNLLEPVLVYNGCMEAMMHLYSFAKELLPVICSKIEEVNVNVNDQRLRISIILPSGHQVDSPQHTYYNVYRVTLKNGEVWAVDTTGAQYGYTDPLSPWVGFEQDRSCKIGREMEFGHIRHHVSRQFSSFPVRHMVAQMIEKEDLTKALEEKFPLLAQDHGGKLSGILKGSDAAFDLAKEKFLDKLEDHLRMLMAKLYTPEQVTRRNKEVEHRLSQNMADPNRRKDLDGFMKFTTSAIGNAAGYR